MYKLTRDQYTSVTGGGKENTLRCVAHCDDGKSYEVNIVEKRNGQNYTCSWSCSCGEERITHGACYNGSAASKAHIESKHGKISYFDGLNFFKKIV